MIVNENKLENTPTGGALVGKRKGQTMIHNKGSMSSYLVGKTHAEGSIKAINKSTGQPLEMQGGEVVITAPAVSDQTKREFDGKMMTNRQILSTINERGGGVAFAEDGMEIPFEMHFSGKNYNYGGKMLSDHDIAYELSQCGCDHEMKKGGNLAKGMSLKQIAKMHDVTLRHINRQVSYGMKAESEHTSSKASQLRIVKDHLYENPNYYTILKTAGLKRGGSLVKDAKKGNTPARDLNNYNDLMDVGVDGEMGDANGLAYAKGGDLSFLDDIDNVFYDGGTIGNEQVDFVIITSHSSAYNALNGKRLHSFKELKKAVREEFNNQNKRFGHFYFEVNGKAPRYGIQIKDGKNTVLNFNPNTGDADDFEKQLLRRGSFSYKKYDWNDWYSGNVSSSGSSASPTTSNASVQQTNNIFSPTEILEIDQLPNTDFGVDNDIITELPPTIQKLVRLREFEIKGSTSSDTLGSAFQWDNSKEGHRFWSKIKKGDYTEFKKMYGSGASGSTTSTKTLTKDDLKDSRIWFGDNIALRDAIIEKLNALGLPLDSRYPLESYHNYIKIFSYDFVTNIRDKADFDIDLTKEIFPADLGIDVNNFGIAPTTATKILTKDDLKNTKIWIGDNPDLSRKVQEKFFELGLTWASDDTTVDNLFSTYFTLTDNGKFLYSDFSIIDFNSQPQKEIFPSDLGIDVNNFGATPINNQMPTDLSQISKGRMKVLFEIKKFVDDNKLTPNPLIFDILEKPAYFVEEETGEVFEFSSGDDSLNPTDKNSSDLLFEFLDFEKSFNDFASKKVKGLSDGIADLDLLAVSEVTTFEKERKEIDALIKLLPAFQESKFAPQKAMILKEIGRLHKKITYEGFIFQNERYSDVKQLFTPQGLLKYYYTQTTQSPVAPLEPACELETPNGAKSKLPLSAYLNVRTSRFKKWFGDWEKAYETNNYVDCSKMIDEETKEPKIFYHGVRKYVPNFGQFSNMGQGVVRPYGSFEPPTAFPASYFSDSEDYAKFYGGVAPNMPKPSADYEPFIYKVFLSAKNPISLLPLGFESSYKDMIDYLLVAYGVRVQPSRNVLNRIQNDMKAKHPVWVYVRNDIALLETLKDYGYDALIQTGDIPTFDDSGNVINDRSKFIQDEEYLTFYPTQVKSATVKKSFYFDFFKDIRFNKGGYVRI